MHAMADRLRAAVAAAFLIVGTTSPAAAQAGSSLVEDCSPQSVTSLSPAQIGAEWVALFPDTLVNRLQPSLAAGRFGEALREVRKQFVAAAQGAEATPGGQFLLARMDSLARSFDVAAQAPLTIRSFNPEVNGFGDTATIFRAAGSRRIELTPADPIRTRRAFCWTAISIGRIIDVHSAPSLDALVKRLDEVLAMWESYAATGFSQYPWELAINGIATGRGLGIEPPRTQWIVLHPSLAVQLNGSSFSNLRRLDAVPLEVLGHLWYNSGRTSYWGVSAAVTFSSNADPGIGPLVHVGRNVSLGASWLTGDTGGARRVGLLFSADLYKAISGVPGEVQRRVGALATQRERAEGMAAEKRGEQ